MKESLLERWHRVGRRGLCSAVAGLALAGAWAARAAQDGELLYFPDDEKLRRIDIDTSRTC